MNELEQKLADLEERLSKLEDRHERLFNTLKSLADSGYIHRHIV